MSSSIDQKSLVGGTNKEYNAIFQELSSDGNNTLSPSAEGAFNRSVRKFKENPFVPIGLALCTVAVFNMFTTLKARDSRGFQTAQRFRVGAQLATTVALIGGMQWSRMQAKEKENKVLANESTIEP